MIKDIYFFNIFEDMTIKEIVLRMGGRGCRQCKGEYSHWDRVLTTLQCHTHMLTAMQNQKKGMNYNL